MNARDENGKTPGEMARELKAEGPWKGGVEDAGVMESGGRVGTGRLDEVSARWLPYEVEQADRRGCRR